MEQKREKGRGNPNLASSLADNEASGDLVRSNDLEAEADEGHTLRDNSHQAAPIIILAIAAAAAAAAERIHENPRAQGGSLRSLPFSFRWILKQRKRKQRKQKQQSIDEADEQSIDEAEEQSIDEAEAASDGVHAELVRSAAMAEPSRFS
jgi:hypothetical protein